MLFIDDQGRFWDRSSLKLRLGPRNPSLAFDDDVVRNLGFVAVGKRPGSTRIRLNPATASPVALAALFHKLADDRPDRIVVSSLGDRDTDELCGHWIKATDSISRLVFNAHQTGNQAFLSRRIKTDSLVGSPLGTLLERWRGTEHAFNPDAFYDILRHLLAGRFMIAEAQSGHNRMMIRSLGNGFLSHDARWRRHAVGQSIESHPDHYYGKWAANIYRETLKNDGPRVDDVDVMVKRVGETPQRVRYRRLIVPFQVSADVTWLLGASIIDPSIDLRAER